MAGSVNPGNWLPELKRQDNVFVIYVDVVQQGSILAPSRAADSETMAFWAAVRTISAEQHRFADYNIVVPMDGDIMDFEKRREYISQGERAGGLAVSDILRNIE